MFWHKAVLSSENQVIRICIMLFLPFSFVLFLVLAVRPWRMYHFLNYYWYHCYQCCCSCWYHYHRCCYTIAITVDFTITTTTTTAVAITIITSVVLLPLSSLGWWALFFILYWSLYPPPLYVFHSTLSSLLSFQHGNWIKPKENRGRGRGESGVGGEGRSERGEKKENKGGCRGEWGEGKRQKGERGEGKR